MIERILSGRPVAHVAEEMGVSRTCAHRWLSRYRAHGWEGFEDHSSSPKSRPHATPAKVVAEVLAKRVEHREGLLDLALRWRHQRPDSLTDFGPCRHAAAMGP